MIDLNTFFNVFPGVASRTLLWGAPGVGKSFVAYQLTAEMNPWVIDMEMRWLDYLNAWGADAVVINPLPVDADYFIDETAVFMALANAVLGATHAKVMGELVAGDASVPPGAIIVDGISEVRHFAQVTVEDERGKQVGNNPQAWAKINRMQMRFVNQLCAWAMAKRAPVVFTCLEREVYDSEGNVTGEIVPIVKQEVVALMTTQAHLKREGARFWANRQKSAIGPAPWTEITKGDDMECNGET